MDVAHSAHDGARVRRDASAHDGARPCPQVRFAPQRSIVLVGHSHYFRELLRHFRSDQCVALDASGFPIESKDLDAKKLSNAGIARVELDFEASEVTPVREFQLLFQTELIK